MHRILEGCQSFEVHQDAELSVCHTIQHCRLTELGLVPVMHFELVYTVLHKYPDADMGRAVERLDATTRLSQGSNNYWCRDRNHKSQRLLNDYAHNIIYLIPARRPRLISPL